MADVIAVDPKRSTITLRGPKRTVELKVRDPQQFELVKVGDQVQATYEEAVALSVEPGEAAGGEEAALGAELGAVAEVLQRLGVGERLEVLHRPAVHDVAHRELDDLAALGARDVGDLHDLRRHVARRRVLADLLS